MLGFPKPRPAALDRRESRADLERRYRAASKEVRALDSHTCRICGGAANETHHAERRSTAPDRYADVMNLISVCKKRFGDGGCHQLLTDNILKLVPGGRSVSDQHASAGDRVAVVG